MICKDLILRKWSWCLMFKLLAVFGVSYYEAGWVRCVVGEPVMYESGHVSSGMLAAYTSDRSVQQNDVVKMDNLNDKFIYLDLIIDLMKFASKPVRAHTHIYHHQYVSSFNNLPIF